MITTNCQSQKANFFNMILKSASTRRAFLLVVLRGGELYFFHGKKKFCLVKITFITIEDPRNNPMILNKNINR